MDKPGNATSHYSKTVSACEMLQDCVDKGCLGDGDAKAAQHLIDIAGQSDYIVMSARDLGEGDVEYRPLLWSDGTMPIFGDLEDAVKEAETTECSFEKTATSMRSIVIFALPRKRLNPVYIKRIK